MTTMHAPQPPPSRPRPWQSARALFFGGLLPIVAFAIAEYWYGTMGGLIAGVTFGVGELTYEFVRFRKVQGITIAANALVIILGALSLFEDNAVFFKLQPALLLFIFAAFMIGSSVLKRPFLLELSKKQMPDAPEIVRKNLAAMNTRMGFCLFAIGILSVHAAFAWSTAAWAFLKTVGAPIILVAYMAIEVLLVRYRIRSGKSKSDQQ